MTQKEKKNLLDLSLSDKHKCSDTFNQGLTKFTCLFGVVGCHSCRDSPTLPPPNTPVLQTSVAHQNQDFKELVLFIFPAVIFFSFKMKSCAPKLSVKEVLQQYWSRCIHIEDGKSRTLFQKSFSSHRPRGLCFPSCLMEEFEDNLGETFSYLLLIF